MKMNKIIFTAMLSALFTANVFAGSPLETNQWAEGKGDAGKYSVVSSTKQLKGVADDKGNVILDTIYKDVKLLSDWNMFAVQTKDGKWTITNVGGDRYFKGTYDFVDIEYYKGGFVEIGNYGSDEFSNNIGILNKNMEFVVPVEYQTYFHTYDDKLMVGKLNNDKYDYYTLLNDGTLEYTLTSDGILSQDGKNGYYITHKKTCADTTKGTKGYIKTLGLCDSNFNVVIEPAYENTAFSYYNNLAIVKKGSTSYTTSDLNEKTGNGKYGIIDRAGNELVKCKYDSIVRTGDTYALTLNGETTALKSNELYNNGTIQILLNGVNINTENEPYIKEGYTMLPLRTVAEALGAEVNWNSTNKTITISKDSKKAELLIGSNEMITNSMSITIPVPAEIVDNVTYVPLRSIATALDTNIKWDSENKIVNISNL